MRALMVTRRNIVPHLLSGVSRSVGLEGDGQWPTPAVSGGFGQRLLCARAGLWVGGPRGMRTAVVGSPPVFHRDLRPGETWGPGPDSASLHQSSSPSTAVLF